MEESATCPRSERPSPFPHLPCFRAKEVTPIPKPILILSFHVVTVERDPGHNPWQRPCAHVALHFVLRSHHVLPIPFRDLERLQIDPVDDARVDRQFPHHRLQLFPSGMLELVHDRDTTCRTESVPAHFTPESVDGEMVSAPELDVFFGGVDPEVGVLFAVMDPFMITTVGE